MARRRTFDVIEYSSFYAVRHNATGEEHPMSDGVDTLFAESGRALQCGSERFRKRWERLLNQTEGETLEAYFPHLVDDSEDEKPDWSQIDTSTD